MIYDKCMKLGIKIGLKKSKKYIGSCCGNSFVILDCRGEKLDKKAKADFAVENINKYGVDSALFLCKSNCMNAFMEIYEKDGSESDSCGNGTILIAYLLDLNDGKIEMKDNAAIVKGDSERQSILMSVKFSEIRKTNGDKDRLFVRVGEPHMIYLVDDLEKFDLVGTGEKLQKEYPGGVNVDAIQKVSDSCYLIKTYERGVFAETDSCGTGSMSAYLAISYFCGKVYEEPIEFRSSGGSHWVSRDGNMLKLETLKKFCKIKAV